MSSKYLHLNETLSTELAFVFESNEDDVIRVSKSFTDSEETARHIAFEILANRNNWFQRGIDAGRAGLASDLRSLLNVPQMEAL